MDAEEGFNVIEETSFCPLIRLDWVASKRRQKRIARCICSGGGGHSGAAEKLLKKKVEKEGKAGAGAQSAVLAQH